MTDFNSVNNLTFKSNLPVKNSAAHLLGNFVDAAENKNLNQNTNQILNQNKENINNAFLFDYNLAKMDNETLLKYLKSLLNMPSDIEKFVQSLSKQDSLELQKILIKNQIDIKELKLFLSQNSKDAISKLINLISSDYLKQIDINSEIKDIWSILNSIQLSSSNLNHNSLRELFLLYIPLEEQFFDKTKDVLKNSDESMDKPSNAQITLLFETNNFSNLYVSLTEDKNYMFAKINCAENFPFCDFMKKLEYFSKQKNFNLNAELNFKKSQNANKQQNIKVMSQSTVSLNILLVSKFIIKMVFEIDNYYTKTT